MKRFGYKAFVKHAFAKAQVSGKDGLGNAVF